jgi:hypothetical protein
LKASLGANLATATGAHLTNLPFNAGPGPPPIFIHTGAIAIIPTPGTFIMGGANLNHPFFAIFFGTFFTLANFGIFNFGGIV